MAGGTLSSYPWLRFIAPNKVGYNIIKHMNQKMKTFLMGFVEEHHKTWTDGNNTDLMYSFISKMNETEGNCSFADDQLLMVSVDLLVGGAHTAGGTLTYACLLMLLHQDVQDKVQKELDENCLNNCFRFSDRQKLPYTQAVLLELIRMYHILPIAGSRRAIRETQISSYTISNVETDSEYDDQVNSDTPESLDTAAYFVDELSSDTHGEEWIQCLSCSLWAHPACAGPEGENYICDFCR
ncbi:hypothetical protein FQA39_LY17504 [Lamprigera yunnana]|nr:hypothetical protein FQA39_LY17504 [Lamprigera yunnana]